MSRFKATLTGEVTSCFNFKISLPAPPRRSRVKARVPESHSLGVRLISRVAVGATLASDSSVSVRVATSEPARSADPIDVLYERLEELLATDPTSSRVAFLESALDYLQEQEAREERARFERTLSAPIDFGLADLLEAKKLLAELEGDS